MITRSNLLQRPDLPPNPILAQRAPHHHSLHLHAQARDAVFRWVEAEGVDGHEAVFLVHGPAGPGGFAVDLEPEGVGFGDQL